MAKDRSDNNDDKSTPLDPSLEEAQLEKQQQLSQLQSQPVSNTLNDSILAETINNTICTNSSDVNKNINIPEIINNSTGSNHSSSKGQKISQSVSSSQHNIILTEEQQRKAEMMADEDPLLISQSLTYVTDDGGVLHSFQSAPFSTGFKLQFVLLEAIFIVLMIAAVPIGAHGTVVAICVTNLVLLAWFWYNLVRSVDVTSDGTLRFWIGNIEVDIPFDKIITINRVSSAIPCCGCCICGSISSIPYRGFLATPSDGVAVVTSAPSTPFWLWPRSSGKPDRTFCFGLLSCPRLTVVFSPAGGSTNFIREVENEMRNISTGQRPTNNKGHHNMHRPSATISIPHSGQQHDYLDS